MRRSLLLTALIIAGIGYAGPGTGHVGAQEKVDLLRQSYKTVPERAALLRDANRHVSLLRRLAGRNLLERPLTQYESFIWLIRHRTAAVLAVEPLLDMPQDEREMALLLELSVRLAHSRLLDRIPPLLERAATPEARLVVVQTLAQLRTEEAVAALREYVTSPPPRTPERHLGLAALGLGRTGNEELLPLLDELFAKLRTRRARAMVAAARSLCGDPEAGNYLLDILDDPDADAELRRGVLRLIVECRPEGAADVLAGIARNRPDDEAGAAAFDALLEVTRYLPMPPQDAPPPDLEEGDAGEVVEMEVPSVRRQWNEASEKERRELVDQVLTQHRNRPVDAGPGPNGEAGPPPEDLPPMEH